MSARKTQKLVIPAGYLDPNSNNVVEIPAEASKSDIILAQQTKPHGSSNTEPGGRCPYGDEYYPSHKTLSPVSEEGSRYQTTTSQYGSGNYSFDIRGPSFKTGIQHASTPLGAQGEIRSRSAAPVCRNLFAGGSAPDRRRPPVRRPTAPPPPPPNQARQSSPPRQEVGRAGRPIKRPAPPPPVQAGQSSSAFCPKTRQEGVPCAEGNLGGGARRRIKRPAPQPPVRADIPSHAEEAPQPTDKPNLEEIELREQKNVEEDMQGFQKARRKLFLNVISLQMSKIRKAKKNIKRALSVE